MSKTPKAAKAPMTRDDAARIQSTAAKANNGVVAKDSFTARAQRASAHNAPHPPSRPTKKARPV